jgi:Flp pilus assembly pilin Flp
MGVILKRWVADEDAQATTEYLLMLTMVLVMVVAVVKNLIGPVLSRMGDVVSRSIQNQLFGANLHTFRVGR